MTGTEAQSIGTLTRTEQAAFFPLDAYLSRVCIWMTVSLLVGAIAADCATRFDESISGMMGFSWWSLPVGMLVISLAMFFGVKVLTSGALAVLILTFSALLGLLLAPPLLFCTHHSLALTFASAAGMFGVMACCEATTRKPLSNTRRALLTLLVGFVIAFCANLFWGNGRPDLTGTVIGIILFSIFLSLLSLKIQEQSSLCTDEKLRHKGSVLGALTIHRYLLLFLLAIVLLVIAVILALLALLFYCLVKILQLLIG